jgi:nucleoside-diphosphate-sugar epimerase
VESLNTSVNRFYQVIKGDKTDEELSASLGCWVDVRDLAQAHLRAIQVEEAGGSRYIISAGTVNRLIYHLWFSFKLF